MKAISSMNGINEGKFAGRLLGALRLCPRRTLQAVVLGAMLLGLLIVAHDVCDRFPFWWSTAAAQHHLMDRLARSDRHDEVLESLPTNDPRSLPILLACLDAGDADIEHAAYHALGRRLDRWRLTDPQTQISQIERLVDGLQTQPIGRDEPPTRLKRELAVRCLQTILRIAPEHHDLAAACQRVLDASAPQLAREPGTGQRPASRFEEQFHLPGGGLPVR